MSDARGADGAGSLRNGESALRREPSVEAELRKLARVLDVDPDRLSALRAVPGEELRALRRQVGDSLFEADRAAFARVAALAKTVPTALAAKLAEAVFPPLLAARSAELLDPRRAADMVGRLSLKYLCEIALVIDAGRAPHLISALPDDTVTAVGAELGRREEWVVIGSFVDQVTDSAMADTVAQFDGRQLLYIGYVLDDLGRLRQINDLLSDAQFDELLLAAAEHGAWPELCELARYLTPEHRDRMGARWAALPDDVRAVYLAAHEAGHIDDETRAIVGA